MKKAVKWFGIALVVLALTAVVAILIANNKYQLFAGPKISHEILVGPGTSMRAVIQPALAKPLILEKLGPQAPPEWLLSRVIPYEAAILCSPDLDAKRFDVVLFLNPQRLTPLVAENAASLGIPRRIPFVKWKSDTFDTSTPGVLSLAGSMDIDDATLTDVRQEWGQVTVPSRPMLQGNHLAEVSIDNRDGSLYTLIAMCANKGMFTLPVKLESLRTTIAPVGTMSLTTDLRNNTQMDFHMIIDCLPTAEQSEVTSVSFLFGAILGEITNLAAQKGADFTGTKKTEGASIIVDYTLSDFDQIIPM